LTAVLLDVGGTLWPDGWPWLPDDHEVRAGRLRRALPDLGAAAAAGLLRALDQSAASLQDALEQDPDRYVGEPLHRYGIEPSAERVAAAMDAMCLPAHPSIRLLPGAPELLRAVRRAGLRSVVVSNSFWRGAAAYARDFRDLGVAGEVDAIVTSVDVRLRKPHRGVFEAGLAAARAPAERCAMVGNSEAKDVRPARALGIRTIRVAIEEPVPATSEADAVTGSLHQAAALLRSWAVSA